MRRRVARSVALLSSSLVLACGGSARVVLPETTLGTVAKEWLFAHNQGDGHAMVHFTLGNRGSAGMTGSQVDSAVYAGVRFARELGPLEPVALMWSTDSSLAIVLRSKTRGFWTAEMTLAEQPSPVRVKVNVRGGSASRPSNVVIRAQ